MVNYALELQTVQASAFRILVEALKEILTDANFEFDESGMKIVAMIHRTPSWFTCVSTPIILKHSSVTEANWF